MSQNTGISGKKANAQLDNQIGNGTLGHETIGQTAINNKVSTAKRAKAQLSNHVGYRPLGHITVKQNNHKVITVGQSPATWDRTHPRNLLQMTVKVNQGVNPRLSGNGHTHETTT